MKAVEYFIKDKFDALGIVDQKEFVHFGLTSQDINNTSVPLGLKVELVKKWVAKVCIFWEGHNILRNLHLTFIHST